MRIITTFEKWAFVLDQTRTYLIEKQNEKNLHLFVFWHLLQEEKVSCCNYSLHLKSPSKLLRISKHFLHRKRITIFAKKGAYLSTITIYISTKNTYFLELDWFIFKGGLNVFCVANIHIQLFPWDVIPMNTLTEKKMIYFLLSARITRT